MTQKEIIGCLFSRCNSKGFLQVSPPLQFRDEGPFVVTLAYFEDRYYCFAFEVLDAGRFLSDPAAQAAAYSEDEFFEMVARHMDFSALFGSEESHPLIRHKLIPDEPACRSAVQTLWQSQPQEAARILMITSDGSWFTGEDIREMPAWLV